MYTVYSVDFVTPSLFWECFLGFDLWTSLLTGTGLDWPGCVEEEQTVTSRQQLCDALRSIPEVQVRRSTSCSLSTFLTLCFCVTANYEIAVKFSIACWIAQ